jgi:hypothetical protein
VRRIKETKEKRKGERHKKTFGGGGEGKGQKR